MPGPVKYLAPKAYTFQMLLKPGVDVTVRIKNLAKKENTGGENRSATSPSAAMTFRRDIREGLVCVVQDSNAAVKEPVRYYVGGWCAYDDPRRGLNMARTSFESFSFPMETYHFPELLWAKPNTRQPDPAVKEGAPKINLYKAGDQTLEVDAASGYPVHFLDGDRAWTYSYTPDTTPIVVPGKLVEALSRVLSR